MIEGQIEIDRPEGQDNVQENDEDPAMRQASLDDLADGQASKLPATSVDQLFAARRIKKVGSRAAQPSERAQIPVTTRLSKPLLRPNRSYSQKEYYRNSEFMNRYQRLAPFEHRKLI